MSEDIDLIFKKYKQGKREDLIPMLQDIQSVTGYIPEEAVIRLGKFLGLSTTKIYGLATFYDKFRFLPAGKIQIKVCNGTSCFLNGSRGIVNRFMEETAVIPGQTTRDGFLSYEIVPCMGGCNNGPVISVNGEFHHHVRMEQVPDLIKKLRYIIEND